MSHTFTTGAAQAVAGFVALAILFWVMESLWPEDRAQPKWRRDSLTDTLYWFLGYGVRFLASILVLVALLVTIHLVPRTGVSAIGSQPAAAQTVEVILLGDLIGYWTHRIFHTTPTLWPIHAVHHSPERVDWLASARVHPLDTIVHRLVEVTPLFLLGFSHVVLGPYALFLAIYPIYLHANLTWSYGPFRWVVASPAYHRWHHAADVEALDKNFAGLFPVWDVLFGTAYFPKHRHPVSYGLYGGERMPRGVIRQTLYPFRKRRLVAPPAPAPEWPLPYGGWRQ